MLMSTSTPRRPVAAGRTVGWAALMPRSMDMGGPYQRCQPRVSGTFGWTLPIAELVTYSGDDW